MGTESVCVCVCVCVCNTTNYRNDIELLSQVGHGTFGTVYHGRGKDLTNVRGVKFGECAVKCVRGDAKPPDR